MNMSIPATKPVNTPLCKMGDWAFVSGITGRHGEALVDGGFEAEFGLVLERFQALLEHHSLSLRNVAKVTLYLTDMSNRERMNEMYLKFFDGHLPARTVVGVTEIARNGAVELEAYVSMAP